MIKNNTNSVVEVKKRGGKEKPDPKIEKDKVKPPPPARPKSK
jgi:hypothetical protein